VYLALNGALHDSAIAAWDLKRRGESSRPLTLIRWMAQNGQCSDPGKPSYNPDGLPLAPGLSELITADTVRPGAKHAHLRPFVGQVAVHAWRTRRSYDASRGCGLAARGGLASVSTP
jgi:hypothetical protein